MEVKLWNKNFIIITIINLLLFFGFQIMLATLPVHAKALGASDSYIGWISGVITISSILMRIFIGNILDKYNKKLILILGTIIIIIFTALYGYISALTLILVIRFIHGLGWAVANTSSNTMAADVIPKNRFGEGMGFFGLSSSLAMSIAPAVALTLLASIGFTNISLLSAGIVLLSLFFSVIYPYRKEKVFMKSSKGSWYEKTSLMPSFIMLFVTSTYGAILSFIAIYSAEQGIGNIGLFFTVLSISILIVRPIAGKVFDLYGDKYIVIPSLILVILSLGVLSISTTITYFLICAALYGAGFGSIQSSLQTLAVVNATKDRRGAATATFYIGFDGGIGLGSVLGGIIATSLGYSNMYQIFALILTFPLLLYIFTKKE